MGTNPTANQKIKLRSILRISEGFELKCLRFGAMPLSPANLIAEIAAFLIAATFCGIGPDLAWLLSSPKVTSRTQCNRFSIAQWPRFSSSNCLADACWGGQAGDKISNVSGGFISNFDSARNAANLADTGPIIIARKPRTCFENTILGATVALVDRRMAVELLLTLRLGTGGKARPKVCFNGRLQVRLIVFGQIKGDIVL